MAKEKDLLDELLDRWDDERAAGRTADPEQLCSQHPELLPKLVERIRAFQQMDQMLNRNLQTTDVDTRTPNSAPTKESAKPVGGVMDASARYRIVAAHARGGLGEVLLATDESLSRQVALKRMLQSGDRDSVRQRRFLREAEITGQLDHPGIVPILNVGQDDSGCPCYTMKFVDGKTLDQSVKELHESFSRRAQSGASGRGLFESVVVRPLLTRFVLVCNTIAFAHSRGIIHRDIKPANIMLGDFGATYVLDWGLAKAADSNARPQAAGQTIPAAANETIPIADSVTENAESEIAKEMLTRTGTVLGTPAYMSPEQASADLSAVGPNSDVYSLGATLYYLLTGRPAIVSGSNVTWLDQLRNGSFARPRNVQPLISASLESVCLKAMSLQPTERYETAVDLAADIEHWLADEPVSTTEETKLDKLARFMRQHRSATLTFVASLMVISVAATIFTLLFNQQKNIATDVGRRFQLAAISEKEARTSAERAAAAARTAELDAQKKLAQIEKANGILTSVFETLDPTETAKSEQPLQVLLVQQLEQAIRELDGDAIGDPLVVAEMQMRLGKSLIALSEPGKAIPVLRKALETRTALLGDSHADTLMCQLSLAEAIEDSGAPSEAVPMMESAMTKARAVLDDGNPVKSSAINNVASAYMSAGKIPQAIELFQEAVRLRKTHFGDEHLLTITSMNNLAMSYGAAGQRELALPMLEDVARLTRTLCGPDDPRTLSSVNNLAIAMLTGGHPEKSLPLFEDTLKHRQTILGREHLDTLQSMNNLAANYQTLSMWPEALSLLAEAEPLLKKKFGEQHPGRLAAANNLGVVRLRMKQPEAALPVLEEVLKLRQTVLPENHPETLSTEQAFGQAQLATGQTEAGLQHLEHSLAGRMTKLGPSHPKTIEGLILLTDEYQKLSRPDDIDRLFRLELAGFTDVSAKNSTAYSQVLAGYGQSLLKQKRWTDAEPVLRECLDLRQKLQPDAPTTFSTQSMLGESLMEQSKFQDAEPLLISGYMGLKERETALPPQLANRLPESIDRVIQLFQKTDRADEAQKWQSERAKYPAVHAP